MRLELPVLLAPRLAEIERIVLGAEDDLALTPVERLLRDVELERRVAADVLTESRPVHPHLGQVIHRAKVQYEALTGQQDWRLDPPTIPARTIEAGVLNTAR